MLTEPRGLGTVSGNRIRPRPCLCHTVEFGASMPKGPEGQKRPADVIGNAVRVMQIATGEREEQYDAKPPKDEAAASLGRRGGAARAKNMTPERRAEIAKKAAEKRWGKG